VEVEGRGDDALARVIDGGLAAVHPIWPPRR